LEEVLHEDYLHYRIASVQYLGQALMSAGVPIVQPPGGHAIYIDASGFLPHIPPCEFPGQALVVALYLQAGIRAVEIGSLMFGRTDADTHEKHSAPLELVRLAIPRRVYTQSHLDYVAEAILQVFERWSSIRGLKLTYQAPFLRHFTARLEPI
jgi:tryptophanase